MILVRLLFVEMAAICDDEIYHYHLNLRKNISSGRILTRLPSNPKNGLKFRHGGWCLICCVLMLFCPLLFLWIYCLFFLFSSGTEVCLFISESIDVLVSDINHFFQKVCSTALWRLCVLFHCLHCKIIDWAKWKWCVKPINEYWDSIDLTLLPRSLNLASYRHCLFAADCGNNRPGGCIVKGHCFRYHWIELILVYHNGGCNLYYR